MAIPLEATCMFMMREAQILCKRRGFPNSRRLASKLVHLLLCHTNHSLLCNTDHLGHSLESEPETPKFKSACTLMKLLCQFEVIYEVTIS